MNTAPRCRCPNWSYEHGCCLGDDFVAYAAPDHWVTETPQPTRYSSHEHFVQKEASEFEGKSTQLFDNVARLAAHDAYALQLAKDRLQEALMWINKAINPRLLGDP